VLGILVVQDTQVVLDILVVFDTLEVLVIQVVQDHLQELQHYKLLLQTQHLLIVLLLGHYKLPAVLVLVIIYTLVAEFIQVTDR